MRLRLTLLFLFLSFFGTNFLYAESMINCQNGGSATLGDLKQEVRLSCGEPERTEIIGYIDKIQDDQRIRVEGEHLVCHEAGYAGMWRDMVG